MDTREQRMGRNGTVAAGAENEKRGAVLLRTVFFGMLQGLWGYALSATALPFGAAPFGVALLCAADRRAVYVLAGAILWAIGSEEWALWTAVFLSVIGVRILTRLLLDLPGRLRSKRREEVTLGEVMPHFFREHVALRMATSAVAVFAVGAVRLRVGGYLFYDLFGTILSVLAAPAVVLLLCGFYERDRDDWRHQLGFLTLGTLLCYGTADWKFYGISLGIFGAMFASLYVSRKRGAIEGMVTGTLFGLAIAPFSAPMFGFGALAAGLLFSASAGLGTLVSFFVSLGWGYYVYGFGILNGVFAALLSSHVLFSVWDRLFGSRTAAQAEAQTQLIEISEERERSLYFEDRIRLDHTNQRIQTLCRGFRELGELFDRMARSVGHVGEEDLKQICDRAFDACCTSCPNKTVCWKEDFGNTSDAIGKISAILHQRGRVRREEIDRQLCDRCGRMNDILEEIHHNTARYEAKLLESDRAEIFSEDFRMLSEMLAVVMTDGEREYEVDPIASERLGKELCEKGIDGTVSVIGKRTRRVLFWSGEKDAATGEWEAVRSIAESCIGVPLEKSSREGQDAILELVQRKRLTPRIAKRTVCAQGEEEFCGDTVETFCSETGDFYALISDGMGSGREASATSSVAGIFLRKLLEAEGGCEEALRLLNVFLRNRGSGSLHECSATADLVRLDLMDGRASFYKSGAAPTYVYREGGLFKLRSRTVPLGILKELDVKKIGLDIGEGDLLIMVSDGVTQGREECPWLYDLLRGHAEHSDVERIADLVVKYAKDEGSSDDISVLVMRLEAA